MWWQGNDHGQKRNNEKRCNQTFSACFITISIAVELWLKLKMKAGKESCTFFVLRGSGRRCHCIQRLVMSVHWWGCLHPVLILAHVVVVLVVRHSSSKWLFHDDYWRCSLPGKIVWGFLSRKRGRDWVFVLSLYAPTLLQTHSISILTFYFVLCYVNLCNFILFSSYFIPFNCSNVSAAYDIWLN